MLQDVSVQFDKQALHDYIQVQIDAAINTRLWFVTVEDLAKLTNMSKRFLEGEILCDPRMKVIERRKARKRWWPAEQAFKVINEITTEW